MSCRTLHVARSFRPETGGVAVALHHLAVELRGRGHEVTLASLDAGDQGREGIAVLGRTSRGYGYAPGYVSWLRAQAPGFDAVVVHGLWQYPGFGAWRALRRQPTPYLVYCHGMLDPWFKRAHPLKHLKKWLYWPWAEYRVLRDAAAVCFTCEEERRLARESFWLYRAREQVASIGIPPPTGEPAAQREAFFRAHPALRSDPFLLFLGRVHPKKGVDLLLQAIAAEGAGMTLAVAGPCDDAAYRAGLEARTRALGLGDRVHWLPMLAGDVKWGALHACEAFVLPSHQENFGVAVVEALACGRPVLISDQVNIWREIVADAAGFAGSDTVPGTREVLARWRQLNAGARGAMASAAQTCFARRFSVGRAADAFVELVQGLPAGRR